MNNQVLIDRELLQELASFCSDSRSYNEAMRVLNATPAPTPDADHIEHVRAMVVPDGWQLVPVEPQPRQQFNAAFNLCNEFGDVFVRTNEKFAMAVYREMLAASPAPGDSK